MSWKFHKNNLIHIQYKSKDLLLKDWANIGSFIIYRYNRPIIDKDSSDKISYKIR